MAKEHKLHLTLYHEPWYPVSLEFIENIWQNFVEENKTINNYNVETNIEERAQYGGKLKFTVPAINIKTKNKNILWEVPINSITKDNFVKHIRDLLNGQTGGNIHKIDFNKMYNDYLKTNKYKL